MTQEEKQLLLQDPCARLPYGVVFKTPQGDGHLNEISLGIFGHELGVNVRATERTYFKFEECKPYLRPLSSMTEEEKRELSKKYVWDVSCRQIEIRYHSDGYWDNDTKCPTSEYLKLFKWLNEHHFDYRGLIEEDLALEATEGMYNIK